MAYECVFINPYREGEHYYYTIVIKDVDGNLPTLQKDVHFIGPPTDADFKRYAKNSIQLIQNHLEDPRERISRLFNERLNRMMKNFQEILEKKNVYAFLKTKPPEFLRETIESLIIGLENSIIQIIKDIPNKEER